MSACFLQVHDLEFAQIEVQVVEGLKNGNAALKKINQVRLVCSAELITVEFFHHFCFYYLKFRCV